MSRQYVDLLTTRPFGSSSGSQLLNFLLISVWWLRFNEVSNVTQSHPGSINCQDSRSRHLFKRYMLHLFYSVKKPCISSFSGTLDVCLMFNVMLFSGTLIEMCLMKNQVLKHVSTALHNNLLYTASEPSDVEDQANKLSISASLQAGATR